ncbi:MAG: DUF624 domain-containing protein [Lachnospiraceae bacterium]|nr:DUF624 domain-containing protein [Lachnospiraceae bacterium]
MKLFNLDSPLMQALNKLADLMWLNVLAVVCCIPVITVGPSLTALHYMALKIVRNEEGYITRGFFKSFKENFKQGVIIWLIQLAVILVLAGDFYIMNYSGLEFNNVLRTILLAISLLVFFTSMFLYPILAKFENTVLHTIRNALFVGVLQFPKTVLMMALTILPLAMIYLLQELIPVVILFGLSVPAWLSAKLYDKFFRKLEAQYMEANGQKENEEDDERIFRDELDESLADHSHIHG